MTFADALDHGEFVARVPALQASAAVKVKEELPDWQCYDSVYESAKEHCARVLAQKINGWPPIERFLKIPGHRLVKAYALELAKRNNRERPDANLRTARRKLKAARDDFKRRCMCRMGNMQWSDPEVGAKFISLRAILEARAEALYWYGIVIDLERAERNEWARARRIVRNP